MKMWKMKKIQQNIQIDAENLYRFSRTKYYWVAAEGGVKMQQIFGGEELESIISDFNLSEKVTWCKAIRTLNTHQEHISSPTQIQMKYQSHRIQTECRRTPSQ